MQAVSYVEFGVPKAKYIKICVLSVLILTEASAAAQPFVALFIDTLVA